MWPLGLQKELQLLHSSLIPRASPHFVPHRVRAARSIDHWDSRARRWLDLGAGRPRSQAKERLIKPPVWQPANKIVAKSVTTHTIIAKKPQRPENARGGRGWEKWEENQAEPEAAVREIRRSHKNREQNEYLQGQGPSHLLDTISTLVQSSEADSGLCLPGSVRWLRHQKLELSQSGLCPVGRGVTP